MKISKLKMRPKNAWNSYREYRKHLGQNANQKDLAVMAAYKALSKNKTVIDLHQVFKETGCFPNGLPKLAIARADYSSKDVHCYRSWEGSFELDTAPTYWNGSSRKNSKTILKFGSGTLPRQEWMDGANKVYKIRSKAIVPTIPPQFRPPDSMLKNYWILFEAVWKVEPPKDPILLRHLGENLYVVVAMWNLTPIEQAVLRR